MSNYDELVTELEALGTHTLARTVANAIATAGALPEWTSETIEHVLGSLTRGIAASSTVRQYIVPGIDDTAAWQRIAIDGGIYDEDDLEGVAE